MGVRVGKGMVVVLLCCSFVPFSTPPHRTNHIWGCMQAGAGGLNDLHWADGKALVHIAVEALADDAAGAAAEVCMSCQSCGCLYACLSLPPYGVAYAHQGCVYTTHTGVGYAPGVAGRARPAVGRDRADGGSSGRVSGT